MSYSEFNLEQVVTEFALKYDENERIFAEGGDKRPRRLPVSALSPSAFVDKRSSRKCDTGLETRANDGTRTHEWWNHNPLP
jgi:hypothetical protein